MSQEQPQSYPTYYPYSVQEEHLPLKGRLIARYNHIKRILLARWWILILCVLVGVTGAIIYVNAAPPKYVSEGRMVVNVKLTIPEGSVYSEELGNFLGTQAALMQSPTVLQRARDRTILLFGAQSKLPEIKVTILPKTSVFILEAKGTNPRFVKAFLQACMEEYINLKREMRGRTSDVTLAGMTEEVLRLERELRQYEVELVEFQKSNDVVLLQEQGNTIGAYLAQLNQRISALKSEFELLSMLTEQEGFLDILTGEQSPLISDQIVGQRLVRLEDSVSAGYLKAKQQLLLLKAEQADLGQYLRPKHPKMIALAEEINRRERLLEIYKTQALEQLQSRKNSLAVQLKNLEKEAAEVSARALEVNWKMAEYQRIKNNLQRVQNLYERLLSTIQTLDVNREITPESVTILEDASDPQPARPGLGFHAAIGAVLGLALGILLVMLVEQLDDRVRSSSDVVANFTEQILAQIPHHRYFYKSKNSQHLIQVDDDRHAFLEAYRTLRSAVIYMGHKTPIKRVLITSSLPNEGKSVTAANLAITMAMANEKVLLVDSDLRKGRLHEWFGGGESKGLSAALAGEIDWKDAVMTTSYKNLWFIPRGEPSLNASELFLTDATKKFLEEVVGHFSFVIMDSVPVLVSDDVTSLAPQLDGVLFVLRAGTTSMRVAKAALEQLHARQAKILGLVLNAVHPITGDYHYYYRRYRSYYQIAPKERMDRS